VSASSSVVPASGVAAGFDGAFPSEQLAAVNPRAESKAAIEKSMVLRTPLPPKPLEALQANRLSRRCHTSVTISLDASW
jgi:hypothetical protein